MLQEKGVSARNMGSLITLVILNVMLLSGVSTTGQDTWIAILGAVIIAAPLLLIYARLAKLLPGMGLLDMISHLFGRAAGAIVGIILSLYALLVCALALNGVTEFTFIFDLENTPQIVIMALILAAAIYLSRGEFSLMGRWSLIACVTVLLILISTIVLALHDIDLSNLKPVMNHSFEELASDSFTLGSAAFGETVLALSAFGALKKSASPYKAFMGALLIGGSGLILAALRDITLMSVPMLNASIYPSYTAARIIHLGKYLDHVESIISFSLILMSLTKIALCLSTASMGAANALRLKDHRTPLVPIGVAILFLTATLLGSIEKTLEFLKLYRFIALPFTALLPVVLCIAAEISKRKQKQNADQQAA